MRRRSSRTLPAIAPLLAVAAIATLFPATHSAVGADDTPATSCTACHGDTDWFGDAARELMEAHASDVHAKAGISCHDCHGGNPDPGLADDMLSAKETPPGGTPFRGAPARSEIPSFCGGCHSDADYMKTFDPSARVDQEIEYWTSQHGKRLEAGDDAVATCVDCHGNHGIREAGDPESAVYPTRLAETCAACHADAAMMEGRTLSNGRPLPVDQHARWQRSVHAAALLDRGDLSAPTCNDCHGNHGAAPPGVASVANVCGQCHGREASLFRASDKHAGFELHNELFLGDDDGTDCTACHEPPDASHVSLSALTRLSECATCHGNHSVVRPTVAMLSPLPDVACTFCHGGTDSMGVLSAERASIEAYEARLAALLAEASAANLEGEALFDWSIMQSLANPDHHLAPSEDDSPAPLRPEFERLYEKFRLGPIHFAIDDPATGAKTELRVSRCSDCHEPESDAGLVARDYVEMTHGLTSLTARASRALLRAKRGGVEVREGLTDLDNAVAAQVDLEVSIHSFEVGEGSSVAETHAEGIAHAEAGLSAAREALEELSFRRQGLAVSLVFVALVLVALALKIRQLPGG